MTTHPAIDRLASLSSEELTVGDVVFVLGLLDRKPVDGLIKSGALEAQQGGSHARGADAKGRSIKFRYSIASAAVLTYLIKITGGDKAVILDAVRQRFPHHHALCLRVAQGGREDTREEVRAPDNVIPMHGSQAKKVKGVKSTPDHPGQMLLFPLSEATKASA